MTHISRPLQIALAAMALFVAVWFVALRGHSGGGEGAGSSASSAPARAAAPTTAAGSAKGAGSVGSPSHGSVYHGPAPGVEGLSRAITKAQGAVAQSQQNAKQLQQKSAEPSSPGTGGATQASGQASQSGSHASPSTSAKSPATTPKATHKSATPSTTGARNAPAKQALVEGELKSGRTVILLFWNPKGTVDLAVRHQLQALQAFHRTQGLQRNRNIPVHEARAGEVGSFGTITRSVQVNETPTMLIIAPNGNTKTLTGLADAYTIQQAISEARHS
jgi:hypothetical protein